VASGDSGRAEAVAQDLVAEEAAAAVREAAEREEVAMAPRALAEERAARELRICGRRVRGVAPAGWVPDWAEGWESEGAPEQDLDRAQDVEAGPTQALVQVQVPVRVLVQVLVLARAQALDQVVRGLEEAGQDLVAVVRALAVMVPELAAVLELEVGEESALVAGLPEGGWRRRPRFEALHLQD